MVPRIGCWVCLLGMGWPVVGAMAAEQYGFKETWAYLMRGEEGFFSGKEPVTDLCVFSARVNDIGRLDGTVTRPRFPEAGVGRHRRIHLVVSAPASKSLMYLCLNKDLETRAGLMADVLAAAGPFDGVQLDFEALRPEERPYYVSFLATLKRKLGPGKILSVALPARTAQQDDAFDYRAIAGAVDRVVIMAYDEHWRTGTAGPIASAAWCEKVLRFALETVRDDKLILGLPLYGRVWQQESLARALKYPQTLALWQDRGKPRVQRTADQTPFFTYTAKVRLDVYFEDAQSLRTKLLLYQRHHIQGVGFWRVGQGPAALWSQLRVIR